MSPIKHGMSNTKFYTAWKAMFYRCGYKNSGGFRENYKKKGINVCKRWEGFGNFKEDMYEDFLEHIKNYGEGRNTTLDRIDNDKGYCPENCRWANASEQQRNKGKYNRRVEINGITKTVTEWCFEYRIPPRLAFNRIYRGWDAVLAITFTGDARTMKIKRNSPAFI